MLLLMHDLLLSQQKLHATYKTNIRSTTKFNPYIGKHNTAIEAKHIMGEI